MSRWGRWLPVAAIVALLGAAMLSAAFGNPSLEALPDGLRPNPVTPGPQSTVGITPSTPVAPPTDASGEAPNLPPWVGWVVTVFCTLAVLTIVGVMAWVMLRDRFLARTVPVSTPLDEAARQAEVRARVRAAVDEGLAELDEGDADPRRVIIACWVRLERAGAAAGTPRAAVDTPADFVSRLLAGHRVSAEVLEAFADVYREARFARHMVDDQMRDQARSALRLLRDELSGPRQPAFPGPARVADESQLWDESVGTP